MSGAIPDDIRFERPGGLRLTERMVRDLEPGSRVLDVGCGSGASVMHMRTRLGLDAIGLDCDEAALADADGAVAASLLCGDAHTLPFADGAFDAVLFECSFSKMGDPDRALAEAARVLHPGGTLAVNDFFGKKSGREFQGLLGRAETRATWSRRFHGAGFDVVCEEDCTDSLRTLWGQLVLDHGLERILADPRFGEELANMLCAGEGLGYFLIVARKRRGIAHT